VIIIKSFNVHILLSVGGEKMLISNNNKFKVYLVDAVVWYYMHEYYNFNFLIKNSKQNKIVLILFRKYNV
jgi:hypothetical protein